MGSVELMKIASVQCSYCYGYEPRSRIVRAITSIQIDQSLITANPYHIHVYRSQGKVMFPEASVSHSVRGGGV